MKDHIYFHRSYRTLQKPERGDAISLVLLAASVDLLVLIFQPWLLSGFTSAAVQILLWCGVPAQGAVQPFLPQLIPAIHVVDAPLSIPGRSFALVNLLAASLITFLLPRVRILPRALLIYVVFISLLNAASSIFFLLFPRQFPYDMITFSILYVEVEVVLWLFLPIVMAIVLATVPNGIPEKFLVVLGAILYSIVFGVVRYATFLYVLSEFSALYMAALFFALGPLFDFVYVVAIYSVYTSFAAGRLERQQERWQWLS